MAFCLWNWRFEDVGDGGVGEERAEENGGEWEVNRIGQRMESDDEVSAERVDSGKAQQEPSKLAENEIGAHLFAKNLKTFFFLSVLVILDDRVGSYSSRRTRQPCNYFSPSDLKRRNGIPFPHLCVSNTRISQV